MKLRPSYPRHLLIIAYDSGLAGLTFLAALYLRWANAMWEHAAAYWWHGMAFSTLLMLGLVLYTRLYRRLWRYVSLKDITTILKICAVAMTVFYAIMFMTTRLEMLPRSVPVIHGLLLIALVAAPRILVRVWHEKRLKLPENQQIPVVLIGATAQAESFIRESMRSVDFAYRVVGVVATDRGALGSNIHHVRVYGTWQELPTIIRKLARKDDAPQRLILADLHLDGAIITQLLEMTQALGLSLSRMPRLSDLTSGTRNAYDIRPIEVEASLGRPQMALDLEAMRRVIAGKRVLITGAGGSIGSELSRQIATMQPARLILLEQSEYALYAIDRELSEARPDSLHQPVIGTIRDAQALRHLFADCKPQVVFHAAALKHVPLCEANICEAVLTNVAGTQQVADMCCEAGVELMVQISTDKAVNPTNVMGACKRIGESYCQALGQEQLRTRFVTVRFGNVLGSTGSVVPLFQQQLQRGGPLTVTHAEMTRYFMTIREAVQLVLQAAAVGMEQSACAAPIYVLDMGEPIRIEDLALQMIRLAGLRPHTDIQIVYTGLRPGEKMHEELFYDKEKLHPTTHPAIQLAEARETPLSALQTQLATLYEHAARYDGVAAKHCLQRLVPEYQSDIPPSAIKEPA